jgi:hypothetical protein
VSIHSDVTVLARIRANGTPKAQQTNCRRIDHPMSLWTSYNAEGTTGWHWKRYPKGKRFCMINGHMRDPICHNMVQIGRPHSKPPMNAISGKVKFVKRLSFKVKSVSRVHEKVKAISKSWCTTSSAYAYGEGSGAAEFWGYGKAVASGHVLEKVVLSASDQSHGNMLLDLQAQGFTDIQVHTKSVAFGKAVAVSSSKAICQDTPAPMTCPSGTTWNDSNGNGVVDEGECQQPTPKPSFQEISLVNRVPVNNTISLNVSGTVAQGHTAELFCTALNGGNVPTDQRRRTVNGSFTASFNYTAPGEVPGELKDGSGNVIVPAAHDMVECTLTQDDSQTDKIRTAVGDGKFEIFQPTPDPM